MKNFHYALTWILKNKGHLYISMVSLSFNRSQKVFMASQKELKEVRKTQIHSALEITKGGKHIVVILCFHHENNKEQN